MIKQEWIDWVTTVVRNEECDREYILVEMTKKGFLDYDESAELLTKIAKQEKKLQFLKKDNARPYIVDTINELNISDKKINIVMSCDIPRIVLFENVLSDQECDELIEMSVEKLVPSTLIDAKTERNNYIDDTRTSFGAQFNLNANALISEIENRLCMLVDWPVVKSEGLQVIRYEIGQQYITHKDWFDPNYVSSAHHLNYAGQRVGTIITYLSDVESGGATLFPQLGLKIRPKKGSALFFANVTDTGTPDYATHHAGLPVLSGTKFIATKWLRARAPMNSLSTTETKLNEK